MLTPQTIKFKVFINRKSVMVSVDSGSTHNFLQPKVVKKLNLTVFCSPQFNVMIGNGDRL